MFISNSDLNSLEESWNYVFGFVGSSHQGELGSLLCFSKWIFYIPVFLRWIIVYPSPPFLHIVRSTSNINCEWKTAKCSEMKTSNGVWFFPTLASVPEYICLARRAMHCFSIKIRLYELSPQSFPMIIVTMCSCRVWTTLRHSTCSIP